MENVQQIKRGQEQVYKKLEELNIPYEYYEHPAAPTAEMALEMVSKQWSRGEGAMLCKNLFFRNHKGNRHYLVIMDAHAQLNIRDLEQRLKQGKLTFASEQRMEKYLGLKPGSVSLFGLVNDVEHHVYVFLDENLLSAQKVSFHPNDNTASLVILKDDMLKFLETSGNGFEFLELYS